MKLLCANPELPERPIDGARGKVDLLGGILN